MNMSEEKQCFVVCPIGDEGSPERKRSDTVLKHFIEPACEEFGYKVIRVDKLHTVDKIDDTIIQYLRTSELVIADITDHNANVFYEFGYRQALKLPLIPIIHEDGEKIPFDITTLRTIRYSNDIAKQDDVLNNLKESIRHFEDFEMPDNQLSNEGLEINSLYNIHEKLDKIIELSQRNNQEVLNTFIDKIASQNNRPKSQDEVIAEMLPTLLSNPEALSMFIELGKNSNNS